MSFAAESDLCEAFAATATAGGWVVYPETAGWDLLLVRRDVQVGVQAKLLGRPWVLLQACPDRRERRGPHYRLALVGGWPGRGESAQRNARAEFCALAHHLRILVATPPDHDAVVFGYHDSWVMSLMHPPLNLGRRRCVRPSLDWRWYRWRPEAPETLPPIVPRVPAGVPSPETVTSWSVAAVRLEQLALAQGHVTVADARRVRDEVGGTWNPSTMLARYFDHCPPPKGRWVAHPQREWRPSARHPGTVLSLGAP